MTMAQHLVEQLSSAITLVNNTNNSLNNHRNENTENFLEEVSDEFKIFLVIAILFIAVVALFGNGTILYAFFSVRKLRTSSNVFIISLTACDLTHALFVMPFEIKYLLNPIWELGITICELHHALFLIAFSASMWSLFSVSCYKYLTIAFPYFAQRLSMKHSIISISLLWFYSVVSSSLPMLGWRNYPTFISSDGQCHFDFAVTWFVFFDSFNFFLPSFLMLVMYTLIYNIARKHAKEIQKLEERLQRIENDTKRPKKNFKAARTMGKIFLVYLVCWLPYTLLLMTFVTCSSCWNVSRYVHNFLLLLAYLNSAVNPFLYATWCQDFRAVIKRLLCREKTQDESLMGRTREFTTMQMI